MKHLIRRLLAATALSVLPLAAQAGNIAECEIVVMTFVEDEAGGGLDVASFRPAGDFLQGIYDEDTALSTEHDGHPIRALMCERSDVIPDEDDYAILATGVPFAISQDFDSTTSDSLTLFFRDGEFRYKFVSSDEMDADVKDALETRLADFSTRDHGLGQTTAEDDREDADSDPADNAEDALNDNAEKELAETPEDE